MAYKETAKSLRTVLTNTLGQSSRTWLNSLLLFLLLTRFQAERSGGGGSGDDDGGGREIGSGQSVEEAV